MPGAVKESSGKVAAKRKRQENAENSKKRRKSGGNEVVEQSSQIQQLETEILESKKHYNNIVTLNSLAAALEKDAETALAAAESLCRVFIHLLVQGKFIKKQDLSEKDATVRAWLWERLHEYHNVLYSMLEGEASAVRAMALIMALLREEAFHVAEKEEAQLPRNSYAEFIVRLFRSPVEHLREQFCQQFVTEFDDIRFYTLQTIGFVSVLRRWAAMIVR